MEIIQFLKLKSWKLATFESWDEVSSARGDVCRQDGEETL